MYLCRYVSAAADPQLGVVDPETERITALTTDAGSLEDTLSIFRVLDAAYEAAETDHWVAVSSAGEGATATVSVGERIQ
jgi:predicted dehydrogenase